MAERELTALKLAYGIKPSALERFWRGRKETGAVTYSVLPSAAPLSPSEKRKDQRRRTRLRSGKILDRANRFMIETAIVDRSSGGLRLRLAKDCVIPDAFHLFDDETELVFAARNRVAAAGDGRGPDRARRPGCGKSPADRRLARKILRHEGLAAADIVVARTKRGERDRHARLFRSWKRRFREVQFNVRQ